MARNSCNRGETAKLSPLYEERGHVLLGRACRSPERMGPPAPWGACRVAENRLCAGIRGGFCPGSCIPPLGNFTQVA